MHDHRYTVEDINRAVGEWMTHVNKRCGSVDNCKAVFVDWLDRLDPAGIRLTKQTREDTILKKMNEALGEIARKYGIALWTATQGTRQADGQDVLAMQHVAEGYHKNDPLDVSIGLGVIQKDDDGLSADEAGVRCTISDDDDNAPPCDRDLTLSIMKNRDNPTAHFNFYQGPTLKFWNSKTEATETTRYLDETNDAVGYMQQHKEKTEQWNKDRSRR
jgi:hypothetical protein